MTFAPTLNTLLLLIFAFEPPQADVSDAETATATVMPPRLTIVFPSDDAELRDCLTIHISNPTDKELVTLRDTHALSLAQTRVRIRDFEGTVVKQKYPFVGSPPALPTKDDYLVIEPGRTGSTKLHIWYVNKAYGMKPSQLYFVTVEVTFNKGKEDEIKASTTFPYGFLPD